MNKIILIFALIAVSNCYTVEDQASLTLFGKFINKYEKKYSTPETFTKRFEIFAANIQEHASHLLYTNEQDPIMTPFFDLTPEEFESQYLTLKAEELAAARSKMTRLELTERLGELPKAYDWIEHGAVTPVKNQGSCGSCWAFSAVANIEGLYQIQSGKLLAFSESELVDCDNVDEGCNGGLMDNAFKWLHENGGLNTEEDYPYVAKRQGCKIKKDKFRVKISGFNDLSQNEDEIAEYLIKVGPLSVALNATPLQFYLGGVFNPLVCNPKGLNHGVTIVGFGEENGKKFWNVKNSWGEGWGESGYFRIIRGVGKCGINTAVSTAVLEKQ